MRLDLLVKQIIFNNSMMFKDVDYLSSKIRVLNELLLRPNNGMRWANTEDPTKGGYITENITEIYKDPITQKDVVKKDKPYGIDDNRYNYINSSVNNEYFKYRSIILAFDENIIKLSQGGNRVQGFRYLTNLESSNEDDILSFVLDGQCRDKLIFNKPIKDGENPSLIYSIPKFIQPDYQHGIHLLYEAVAKQNRLIAEEISNILKITN